MLISFNQWVLCAVVQSIDCDKFSVRCGYRSFLFSCFNLVIALFIWTFLVGIVEERVLFIFNLYRYQDFNQGSWDRIDGIFI